MGPQQCSLHDVIINENTSVVNKSISSHAIDLALPLLQWRSHGLLKYNIFSPKNFIASTTDFLFCQTSSWFPLWIHFIAVDTGWEKENTTELLHKPVGRGRGPEWNPNTVSFPDNTAKLSSSTCLSLPCLLLSVLKTSRSPSLWWKTTSESRNLLLLAAFIDSLNVFGWTNCSQLLSFVMMT